MNAPERIAILTVTDRGIELGRLLRERFRMGDLYRPQRHGPAPRRWEHPFSEPLAERVAELFHRYDQLVFFLAAGATTRLIAPLLSDKHTDPGVTVVDEASRYTVPLLSGHEGGANDFARRVAGALGATPVITTASDTVVGFNLNRLEQAFGWMPEPRDRQKHLAMALTNEEPVALVQEIHAADASLDQKDLPANVQLLHDPAEIREDTAAVAWVTDRTPELPPHVEAGRIVWHRPPSLILGVGCERGVSLEALEDGLGRFLAQHGYARSSIAGLASLDLKADEPALNRLAERHGWRTHFYPAEELERTDGVASGSETVRRCVGTPAVAEPAALRAAEVDTLLVQKQVITLGPSPDRMTFALARRSGYRAHDPDRGRVHFVGAGPGDPDLLTLKARRLIRRADLVLYAGSLVPEQVLEEAPPHAELHNSAHLTLEQTSELMIDAARRGRRVARLHSGCLTAYSAIQEQMTALDDAGIEYDVIPGISAFQAAAAHLKAELTLPGTVQTIVLTRAEGKTKMPEGESLRSLAQHGASLCIFLSARMSERVQRDLLTAYPPETPVSIHYRVSWPDERNIVTDLAHLHETVREHGFTRTTLIMVGEAVTGRRNRSRLYDPTHAHIFRAADRSAPPPSA